jgi:long-chain acyl-CoA synthetase
VAVVVPDYVKTLAWAAEKRWKETTYEDIVKNHYDELQATLLENMKEMGKREKLKTFELIFAIHLEYSLNDLKQGFSVDNDCLTPTFKLKRVQLKERYKPVIDAMYKKLSGK